MTLLSVSNLSRKYGYRQALDDVSFSLDEGEILCIMGPNGAGKSTLLASLISRSQPENGCILFRDQEIKNYDDRKKYLSEIAFIGHDPGLFYDLSALENLVFIRKLYKKKPEPSGHPIFEELLSKTGLLHRKYDSVRSFSRGMKQRLGLARAFMNEPSLVFLDEPLTGLDQNGEEVMISFLKEHKKKKGSALIVTHSEECFLSITDRFLFMKDGCLVADIPSSRYNNETKKKIKKLLYEET